MFCGHGDLSKAMRGGGIKGGDGIDLVHGPAYYDIANDADFYAVIKLFKYFD